MTIQRYCAHTINCSSGGKFVTFRDHMERVKMLRAKHTESLERHQKLVREVATENQRLRNELNAARNEVVALRGLSPTARHKAETDNLLFDYNARVAKLRALFAPLSDENEKLKAELLQFKAAHAIAKDAPRAVDSYTDPELLRHYPDAKVIVEFYDRTTTMQQAASILALADLSTIKRWRFAQHQSSDRMDGGDWNYDADGLRGLGNRRVYVEFRDASYSQLEAATVLTMVDDLRAISRWRLM